MRRPGTSSFGEPSHLLRLIEYYAAIPALSFRLVEGGIGGTDQRARRPLIPVAGATAIPMLIVTRRTVRSASTMPRATIAAAAVPRGWSPRALPRRDRGWRTPRRRIGRSRPRARTADDKQLGDLAQRGIADLMPVLVVDALEVIDVHHHQRKRRW